MPLASVTTKLTFVCVLAVLMCSTTALRSSPQKTSFDVVSIRPNNSGARGTTTNLNGGTVVITNVTLRGLILQAYAALQEELGLKLDSGRGPVQVLVVDDIQQPTEN